MHSNYLQIIQQNLQALYALDLKARAHAMGAQLAGEQISFNAFGSRCDITSTVLRLDGIEQTGPLGIVVSLYALHADIQPLELEPLKAFKEFPDSMPYVGAFASHTENILTGAVDGINTHRQRILDAMDGCNAPAHVGGDSAMVLCPLPKISLCYIFYEADEDFPAAATCLFSANAYRHMPMDGLADVGEYTSRKILELIEAASP